jgi:hypothetical protein
MAKRQSAKAKKRISKPRIRKILITLPEHLVQDLQKEIKRLSRTKDGVRYNRNAYIRDIIYLNLLKNPYVVSKHKLTRLDARKALLHAANSTKTIAKESLLEGNSEVASALFLAAAAKELEALSVLRNPDESTIRSTIIEVLVCLKAGTGYNHLPEVPLPNIFKSIPC